eukprot:scaffold211541_cov15-Tisochrysis_lutea.AAC.1
MEALPCPLICLPAAKVQHTPAQIRVGWVCLRASNLGALTPSPARAGPIFQHRQEWAGRVPGPAGC